MLTSDELRAIRRITLQTGRRVDSLFAGGYRSAFRGRGMEFEEVRPYVPGDDVRHIDWNVTARTQSPHVKEFREERELTLVLAVDASASMDFGSGGRDGATDKRRLMARVAGALAYAATRNNDRVGLLVFTDQIERFVPPRKSRGHAWRVIREVFEHRPVRKKTDLAGALDYLGRVVRRRSTICLLSDFVSDSPWESSLGPLAARHRVHAFAIHDPGEQRQLGVPSRLGGWLLDVVDAETGVRGLIDPSRLKPVGDLDGLSGTLRRCGARPAAIGTHEDPFAALERHFRLEAGR